MAVVTALDHADRSQDGERRSRRADAALVDVDARYGHHLFGLARRSGLAVDHAEDAVQETLLRLWLEVRSGVELIDQKAWTFRTLYRIAMDHHRLRRRAADVAARLYLHARPTLEVDAAERISVWRLVDRLPTRQRQVLYLRYRADMTFDQIAAAMGITSSAARTHASLAASRLRETLGESWND